jgi:hypothetical protein
MQHSPVSFSKFPPARRIAAEALVANQEWAGDVDDLELRSFFQPMALNWKQVSL